EPGTKVIVENVGTSSDVILNFTIPKGDKGEQGQAATITIGTITTGEPETDAIVTNVGDENNAHLNITIPKGQKGADGINPTLSIGTITTLDPDQQAKAEIIPGENGNNILNLGLVKGDKGDQGQSNVTPLTLNPGYSITYQKQNPSTGQYESVNSINLTDGGNYIIGGSLILGSYYGVVDAKPNTSYQSERWLYGSLRVTTNANNTGFTVEYISPSISQPYQYYVIENLGVCIEVGKKYDVGSILSMFTGGGFRYSLCLSNNKFIYNLFSAENN
ncbi:unnamed protein product, partial [Commensalibacter communis]|uniref:hypothetical protein n=1 Tax=Commensalibacter communis TaxID=2972786 RepID=UPI0022FF8604